MTFSSVSASEVDLQEEDADEITLAYYKLPMPSILAFPGDLPNFWHVSVRLVDSPEIPIAGVVFVTIVIKPISQSGVAAFSLTVIPAMIPDAHFLSNAFDGDRPILHPLAYNLLYFFANTQPGVRKSPHKPIGNKVTRVFRPQILFFSDLGTAAAFQGETPVLPKATLDYSPEDELKLHIFLEKYYTHKTTLNETVRYTTKVRKVIQQEVDKIDRLKGWKSVELLLCHACGRPGTRTHQSWPGYPQLKVCTGCKLARYCNEECRDADWTIGKHNKLCKTYIKSEAPV